MHHFFLFCDSNTFTTINNYVQDKSYNMSVYVFLKLYVNGKCFDKNIILHNITITFFITNSTVSFKNYFC